MRKNPIESEIAFNKEGRHVGFLRIPWSSHRSAYGWIPVPVASFKNGEGPCVLLLGGNHGDEYEGQVLLSELIHTLDIDQVCGQIIIIPTANAPAANADCRVSPLDGGNLNRSFSGQIGDGPTSWIAHYIEHELLSRSDYMFDIHAGGSSLHYLPTLLCISEDNAERHKERQQFAAKLGTQFTLWFPSDTDGVFSSSAAARHGVVNFSFEAGGSGRLDTKTVLAAREVLFRFLHLTKVYDSQRVERLLPPETKQFGDCALMFSTIEGLFEALAEPGDVIRKGQPAAHIHHVESIDRKVDTLYFEHDGTVLCRRTHARTAHGDCLYQIGI